MGELLLGVEALNALLTLVANAAAKASQVGALISKAQAEGRTTFTPEEWAQISNMDDVARAQLEAAIKAKSPG